MKPRVMFYVYHRLLHRGTFLTFRWRFYSLYLLTLFFFYFFFHYYHYYDYSYILFIASGAAWAGGLGMNNNGRRFSNGICYERFIYNHPMHSRTGTVVYIRV